MDKIYLITNNINGKQYVGQTKKTLPQRLARHKYDSKRESLEHLPLYRAFKKYGEDNFIITFVGEFLETEINQKEKDFIEKYNTYSDGYNATLGGESRNTIKISSELIVEHYLKTKSCRETGKHFGIDHGSVSIRVKNAGYNILDGRERQSKNYKVIFSNGDIKYFHSYSHVAEYLIEINYQSRSKKVESIRKGLSRAFNTKTPYYDLIITKD